MKIQDLSKDLDMQTMQAVRGGDNGNSATNVVGQAMNLVVPVSGLTYGPSNTSVHVKGTQDSQIGTYQNAGDAYLALLPVFAF